MRVVTIFWALKITPIRKEEEERVVIRVVAVAVAGKVEIKNRQLSRSRQLSRLRSINLGSLRNLRRLIRLRFALMGPSAFDPFRKDGALIGTRNPISKSLLSRTGRLRLRKVPWRGSKLVQEEVEVIKEKELIKGRVREPKVTIKGKVKVINTKERNHQKVPNRLRLCRLSKVHSRKVQPGELERKLEVSSQPVGPKASAAFKKRFGV
jgi:hypothetical protein